MDVCFLLHMLGIHEQSLFRCHCFADLTAQSDNLIETERPILNNDPVWCHCADAELMRALDVLTKIIL